MLCFSLIATTRNVRILDSDWLLLGFDAFKIWVPVQGGGVLSKIITYPPPSPLSSNQKTFYNTRILRKLDEIRWLKPDSPTINTETVWRKQISLYCIPNYFTDLWCHGFFESRIFWFTDFSIFRFTEKFFEVVFTDLPSRKLNENRNL